MEAGMNSLKLMSVESLTDAINAYPWFGAARKELCVRMSKVGGSEWGKEQYSEAAMYVASRTIISGIMRSARREDYSDKDLKGLIKEYIGAASEERQGESRQETEEKPKNSAQRVPGGDFFSPEQYAAVRRDEDNVFSRFKAGRSDEQEDRGWEDPELGFCTETLAGIYADQGYTAEAKKIYSRLILRYPEKSAYFASLIEKLQQQEN